MGAHGQTAGSRWSIIVHGGAGAIDDRQSVLHEAGCRQAARVGARVLAAGGSALTASVAAVRVLERNPIYNAGVGSTLDEDGLVNCDAAVMTGEDLGYGAVGAVSGVQHPIDLARAILEDGRYSLLVGAGAVHFARRHGVALTDPKRLETDPSRSRWWFTKAEVRGETVGAVARDVDGRVASATSTGGLLGKMRGRVGDSPIAGAGTYARADLGAISATGHGETLMKTVIGLQALLDARSRDDLGQSLLDSMDEATGRVGGRGGLIVVAPDGRTAWARNTTHMGVAWGDADHPVASAF